jgi:hypothetical protein
VPINWGQVKQIQKFYLNPHSPPQRFQFEVVVATEKVQKKNDGQFATMKGFPRLSPAEPCHALLFSIQEAIQTGAAEDVLKQWRKILLTVTFVFEVCPAGDTRFWRAQNLREELVQQGVSVQISTRQRIFDVAGFKEMKEKAMGVTLSASKVAQFYAQVKFATTSEVVSDFFVDCALTIYRRVLSIDRCKFLLEWCDRVFLTKNPWKSVAALQALVDRAQTPANIQYCLEGLIDGERMGFLDAGSFVVSKLKDPRNSPSAKH